MRVEKSDFQMQRWTIRCWTYRTRTAQYPWIGPLNRTVTCEEWNHFHSWISASRQVLQARNLRRLGEYYWNTLMPIWPEVIANLRKWSLIQGLENYRLVKQTSIYTRIQSYLNGGYGSTFGHMWCYYWIKLHLVDYKYNSHSMDLVYDVCNVWMCNFQVAMQEPVWLDKYIPALREEDLATNQMRSSALDLHFVKPMLSGIVIKSQDEWQKLDYV